MTRVELLKRLEKLPPPQFEKLLYELDVPTSYLSHNAPQTTRAIELLRMLENEGRTAELEGLLGAPAAGRDTGGGGASPKRADTDSGRADASKTQVFISYVREDAAWLQRLQVHLKPLERASHVELWDHSKIRPGMISRNEIAKALGRARIAVLLVSADFLASDSIQDDELPHLLAGAAGEGVTILSVIVGPCLFSAHPELAQYTTVNSPGEPLSTMPKGEAEKVMVTLAETILAHLSK